MLCNGQGQLERPARDGVWADMKSGRYDRALQSGHRHGVNLLCMAVWTACRSAG